MIATCWDIHSWKRHETASFWLWSGAKSCEQCQEVLSSDSADFRSRVPPLAWPPRVSHSNQRHAQLSAGLNGLPLSGAGAFSLSFSLSFQASTSHPGARVSQGTKARTVLEHMHHHSCKCRAVKWSPLEFGNGQFALKKVIQWKSEPHWTWKNELPPHRTPLHLGQVWASSDATNPKPASDSRVAQLFRGQGCIYLNSGRKFDSKVY